jgi:hypothetical protein
MAHITLSTNPIDYFNNWLKEPVNMTESYSVLTVMDALNIHPVSQDETAQDYFMPKQRYRESAGRFRIYGENQDGWYFFVYAEDEHKSNPSVYFESCLDLVIDCGFPECDIIKSHKMIEEEHVLICERFDLFLWQMVGQQICVRAEGNEFYREGVNGINFFDDIRLGESFANPIGSECPSIFTCLISERAICAPGWGAAFLDEAERLDFIEKYEPNIHDSWIY